MGMGYPVSWRALTAGGRSGLGIDIVSNQSADMFTQMRLNIQVQRALQNDRLIRTSMMPKVIKPTVRQVLELATIRGAEAIGLGMRTGSITPGKEADIILVRTDTVNMFPVNDPVSSIVLCANVGNVDTVMVGGQILKRDGKLVDVDLASVRQKLEKSRDKIIEGGCRKGFAGGEALMSNVFPLDRNMAFGVRLAAMVARSEIKPLQDWFLEKIANSTK
jgi:cytosine/adenosine deaminase-related metal-dependent hydrolase